MALALKLHSFSLLILQSIEHYLHIRRLLHMILFCYLLAKLRHSVTLISMVTINFVSIYFQFSVTISLFLG